MEEVGLRGLTDIWGEGCSFMACIGMVLAQAAPAHSIPGATYGRVAAPPSRRLEALKPRLFQGDMGYSG